ncbi:SRPBCC family protein [Spirosoma montaniterrae]|uniref:Cyclase n=1 Tax=Spirosoma montaniterrae TaxID=1178516 RepID=A0A1P9X4Y9_9BACT|nr:SRPBCC family protein [Spirosoma montaniterrae]AQG82658.1 cyclase [Spirosoma montaniterrae]
MAKTTDLAKSGIIDMAPVDPIASGSSRINIGETERYISVGGGALLTTVGLKTGGFGGLMLTALGGYLVYRGATGYCAVSHSLNRDTSEEKTETDVLEISKSLTINKPRAEVYAFWRKLENLPKFMQHLESVTEHDNKRSHWVAKVSTGNKIARALPAVEWDAEIVEEDENSRIVWRSVPGATVDNSGEVRFVDAPGNRGTEVHATIKYRAPEGIVGEAVLKLLNPALKQMVKEDIRRFKRLLEAGEIPTLEGQPSGREKEGEAFYKKQPTQHKEYEGVVL